MTPTKSQIKSRDMAELAEYRRYLNMHIPPERSSQSALAVRLSGPNGET